MLANGGTLRVEGVTKRFGDVVAVDSADLEVLPGETVALLGPSGCGKSTLLRLVAGLEAPDSGRILAGERELTRTPPQERGVGMVFQAYSLFPHLDVAGNVAFGLVEARVPPAARQARVAELLELVGLPGLGSRKVEQLSGGQQQRVALARALAPDPDLLLLDEPLSNLDEQLKRSLAVELKRVLGRLGKRAIYVTHDQAEAFGLAERVALMRAGRIVQVGAPSELLNAPAGAWAARFVGHENVYDDGPDGRPVLFRADLATLEPSGPHGGEAHAGAHAGAAVPVRVVAVTRERLSWRLDLEAAAEQRLGGVVIWRGMDREVRAAFGEGGPEPGATAVLRVPPEAWVVLRPEREG